MGNVQVHYREQRGTHEAGSAITDPKDFFEELINGPKYAELKAMYDGSSAEQKAQIDAIFDGADMFLSQSSAQMWYEEAQEEPETLQTCMEAVKPMLGL